MQVTAVYWPACFEEPIVLYDGPAALHIDEDVYEGEGQLVFRWRRSPTITWSFASNDEGAPLWLGDSTVAAKQWFEGLQSGDGYRARTDCIPWGPGSHDGCRFRTDGYQPQDVVNGVADGFSSALLHIVNFVD